MLPYLSHCQRCEGTKSTSLALCTATCAVRRSLPIRSIGNVGSVGGCAIAAESVRLTTGSRTKHAVLNMPKSGHHYQPDVYVLSLKVNAINLIRPDTSVLYLKEYPVTCGEYLST